MSDTTNFGGQEFVIFGPDANCTLQYCPIEASVLQYRPSLAASGVFIALFTIAMAAHIYLGIRWRTWGFMVGMIFGCIVEILGYVGRIIMHGNPFDFSGFLMQIVLITTGPVFFTASIYVTLSKTVVALAPELSRFKPNLFYWIFIPADVLCLILQAAGGALSTVSSGSSNTGVNVSLAGLGLQVAVLVAFIALFTDYLVRYIRSRSHPQMERRTQLFFGGLFSSIILILGRCAYRCYELSQGYQDSEVITDEGLFIALEGVLIALAVFLLCIGHPGLLLGRNNGKTLESSSDEEMAQKVRK